MVREFIAGWDVMQILGEGAYAEVKLLVNRETGEACAMKVRNNIKNNLYMSISAFKYIIRLFQINSRNFEQYFKHCRK